MEIVEMPVLGTDEDGSINRGAILSNYPSENFEETREKYPANVEESSEFNEVSEAERQQQLKQQVEAMLSNPQVRANALANAQDLKKRFKGWFRVQDVARKLLLKPKPVLDLLNLLCLFEMVYRKEHRGELRYKVVLGKEDRLIILKEELAGARNEVAKLEQQIESLSNN